MLNIFQRVVIVVGVGVCLHLSACGGSRSNDAVVVSQPSLDAALQKIVDGNIIPAARRFSEASSSLASLAIPFCDAPTQQGLEELQQQWRTTANTWYGLLPYNFGPLNNDVVFPNFMFVDSYRLRGTHYLATVRSDIAADIAADNVLNEAYFSAKNFQRVGLLALEVNLFETSAEANNTASAIVDEFAEKPRKCEILIQQGLALEKRADQIWQGWTQNYNGSGVPYRDIFIAGNFEDGSTAVAKLLGSVQEFLDYLKLRNVVTTITPLSQTAWQMMTHAIDEVELLVKGDGSTTFTLFGIMTAGGYEMSVETVEENISAVRSGIQSQDASLFGVAVAQLDGNFKREIPDGLEVDLGLTFTDGD